MSLISRRIALTLCLASLVGCSLAPVVSNESEDYNETVETVTNSLLVVNILRARDEVPLYFTDLSQIRGQIMLNYSAQGAFPFGPSNRSGTGIGLRSVATIGIAQQNLPFFDIAPLNNKQFYQGIIEPLSKGVFAFYLNSAIPPAVLFNIFVSGIETVKVNGDKISYEPYCGYLDPCFDDFIERWTNRERPPRAVVYNQSTEIGLKVAADAKALVEAALAGLSATKADGNLVQLAKKSTQTTICVADASGTKYVAVGIATASVFKTPEVSIPQSDDECKILPLQNPQTGKTSVKEAPSVERQLLRLRSVQEIFTYLGFLVRNKNSTQHAYNLPDIGFNISEHPPPEVRFVTQYQGKNYYVSNVSGNDNTLRILAVLNGLLNLNRDANAIPKTPAVQAIGG
jgi:hypothetical protein